ncbi:MAG: hypothetical protein HYY42_01880 [Chloroflexi bacterium]|nr:hypothetical protein [Chloroflexota bacterium]MBI2982929.1 hypothetical protein [Chloroflexota bacterium]
MAVQRLVSSVMATTIGLGFWWGMTEPLPVAPLVLYGVPALILFGCGVIAGGTGAVAAPTALAFSLLLGSLIATQMHQAFAPASLPVSRFGDLTIDGAELLGPLVLASLAGVTGGYIGERILPTRSYR